jgi:3-oxoacyl-[acyl-carrier protein] reductase
VPGELDGKTALVTGSGRNIGRAIVLELASRGANVVVNTRSNADEAAAVERQARDLGAEAMAVVGDVSSEETVDAMKQSIESRFGGVDILVSNAALRPYQSFFDMPTSDFVSVLNVQLVASFRLAQAFAPGMVERQWGRIIHITGPDAFVGLTHRAHNVTAKGGLRALTKALAIELGPYGITVNDVAPGAVRTADRGATHPRVSGSDGEELISEEGDERIMRRIPVGRWAEPEDVAYACGFLASPRAGYYTGNVLCCFGGMFMPG